MLELIIMYGVFTTIFGTIVSVMGSLYLVETQRPVTKLIMILTFVFWPIVLVAALVTVIGAALIVAAKDFLALPLR